MVAIIFISQFRVMATSTIKGLTNHFHVESTRFDFSASSIIIYKMSNTDHCQSECSNSRYTVFIGRLSDVRLYTVVDNLPQLHCLVF